MAVTSHPDLYEKLKTALKERAAAKEVFDAKQQRVEELLSEIEKKRLARVETK